MMPGTGIAQILQQWPKPSTSQEYEEYQKGYGILLDCHAYIIQSGLRPTESFDNYRNLDEKTFQYGSTVWQMNELQLSNFCSTIINSELTPQALVELNSILSIPEIVSELLESRIAA